MTPRTLAPTDAVSLDFDRLRHALLSAASNYRRMGARLASRNHSDTAASSYTLAQALEQAAASDDALDMVRHAYAQNEGAITPLPQSLGDATEALIKQHGDVRAAAEALGYIVFASMGGYYWRRKAGPATYQYVGWSEGYGNADDAAYAAVRFHVHHAFNGETFEQRCAAAVQAGYGVEAHPADATRFFSKLPKDQSAPRLGHDTKVDAWEEAYDLMIKADLRKR